MGNGEADEGEEKECVASKAGIGYLGYKILGGRISAIYEDFASCHYT